MSCTTYCGKLIDIHSRAIFAHIIETVHIWVHFVKGGLVFKIGEMLPVMVSGPHKPYLTTSMDDDRHWWAKDELPPAEATRRRT